MVQAALEGSLISCGMLMVSKDRLISDGRFLTCERPSTWRISPDAADPFKRCIYYCSQHSREAVSTYHGYVEFVPTGELVDRKTITSIASIRRAMRRISEAYGL